MAYIEVTSAQLRAKAQELSELNNQFNGKKGELEEKEGALCSMWEGDAKRNFHQAFSSDAVQMNVFYELIIRYVEALLEIAARYEEAEARNAELAAARSY